MQFKWQWIRFNYIYKKLNFNDIGTLYRFPWPDLFGYATTWELTIFDVHGTQNNTHTKTQTHLQRATSYLTLDLQAQLTPPSSTQQYDSSQWQTNMHIQPHKPCHQMPPGLHHVTRPEVITWHDIAPCDVKLMRWSSILCIEAQSGPCLGSCVISSCSG